MTTVDNWGFLRSTGRCFDRQMRVYMVDTFTQNMFRGNPTGVVLVDQSVDPDWMQAVATELNHPRHRVRRHLKPRCRAEETALVQPDHRIDIVWKRYLGRRPYPRR